MASAGVGRDVRDHQPGHRGGQRPGRQGRRARRRPRGPGGPARVRPGTLAPDGRRRARARPVEARRPDHRNLEEMARLESVNTGKTLFDSGKVELPFAAEVFRYYAGWTTKIHGETSTSAAAPSPSRSASPRRRRRDRALEFPVPPRLLEDRARAGRREHVVLKPAELTPLTALRFAELPRRPASPRACSTSCPGRAARRAWRSSRHPGVDKIAFTGSTDVGKGIMREAAGILKRVSLELGGKSPNIVFADADLEAALRGAMAGDLLQQGRGLRGRLAALRGAAHPRRVRREARRPRQGAEGRRPDGQDDADGPGRLGPAAPDGARATSRRAEEGATLAAGGERVRVGDGRATSSSPRSSPA